MKGLIYLQIHYICGWIILQIVVSSYTILFFDKNPTKFTMKKPILIIFLVSSFSATILAQGFHYGVQAGMSAATIVERNEWAGNLNKNVKLGMQLGVAIEYEVLSFLSVSSAITFFQKGDKIKDQFATSRASIGYLDIPINIGYKIPLGNFKFTGMVGPYTSVALVGSKSFTIAPDVEPDFEWNFEEHGHDAYIDDGSSFFGEEIHSYKRFDTGISAGVKIGFKNYQISAAYSRGFVDIKTNETISAKNSVFNIALIYFIK